MYFGDNVPTLDRYISKRRATFVDQLKMKLNASKWYALIKDAKEVLARKRSASTKVQNNYRIKGDELRAERDKRVAEADAWLKSEQQKLSLHYDGEIETLRFEETEASAVLDRIVRESYFYGLSEEDDGRRLYREPSIDEAIMERVDRFIEQSLGDDDLGAKVAERVGMEKLVGDIAYIEKSVETMRQAVLRFIGSGDLPPITMKAWNIVDGKDALA